MNVSDEMGTDCTDSVLVEIIAPDFDGDGWYAEEYGGEDCDDSDPDVNPDATEVCDSIDNDCDDLIDDLSAALDAVSW